MDSLPQEIVKVIAEFADGYAPFMRVAKAYLHLESEPKIWVLVAHNSPLSKWYDPEKSIDWAVKFGNAEILEWAYDAGAIWSIDIAAKSAKLGNLNILKWASSRGVCLADAARHAATPETYDFITERILESAEHFEAFAAAGNIVLMEHFFKNHADMALESGAVPGTLEALKWLEARGFDIHKAAVWAAEDGKLDILEYTKILPPTHVPARTGQLEAVKWLYERGQYLTKSTFENAVSSDNLELVGWLIENKCPRTKTAPKSLKMAKLVSPDFELDKTSCMVMIRYGESLGVSPTSKTFQRAVADDNLETAKHLIAKGIKGDAWPISKTMLGLLIADFGLTDSLVGAAIMLDAPRMVEGWKFSKCDLNHAIYCASIAMVRHIANQLKADIYDLVLDQICANERVRVLSPHVKMYAEHTAKLKCLLPIT